MIADVTAFPSLSADARYVAFTAGVSDGYSFNVAQPLVYDSCRGAVGSCTPNHFLLEAVSETGQPVPFAYTSRQSLSADGRYLAFAGLIEATTETGSSDDFGVWVRDSCRGVGPSCVPSTVRASINIDGEPTGGYYPTFAMSASGRYVAFAPYGAGIVLLRDTCIGGPAECVPGTTRVTVNTNNVQIQSAAFDPSISADGRYVAFAMGQFDPYSQTFLSNILVRDTCMGIAACDPKTFLITTSASGSLATGISRAPMLSGDGKFVVFQSDAIDLVPGDANGVTDIFRTELP
jgi:hypothetical protein